MKNVVIVEDDKWSMVTLKNLLENYFPDYNVVGTASSAEEALETITELAPQLVIADIEIDDRNIFDVLESLDRRMDIQIILSTSHENYALKAFSYEVLDYLVKPITLEKLTKSFNKLNKILRQQTKEEVEGSSLNEWGDGNRVIGIASVDKIEVISVDSVLYIQADGRYSHFHLLDGKHMVASKNIGEYMKILPKEDFLRVHHSYIVNMNYVKSVSKTDGSFLELFRSNKTIPISKRKQDQLNKFLKIKV